MGEKTKITRTWSRYISHPLFLSLSEEAGGVYSTALNLFWEVVKEEDLWLNSYELQSRMKDVADRMNLHSDSYLAAMQQVHKNLATWKQAKRVNPISSCPPYREKRLQPIFFKKSQIKINNKKLILTLDRHKSYLNLRWNKNLPKPIYGNITWVKGRGWKLNLVMEFEAEVHELDYKRHLGVDLGVKRTAVLFDGVGCISLSGKPLKALTHYSNKVMSESKRKLSAKQKQSNRAARLRSGMRKRAQKIENKKKDILHKYSKFIVEHAINNDIGNIVIGDCANTHINTNLGKVNNQQVQQNAEQQLKHYIKYKFESIAGRLHVISEHYTSQTCPICKKLNKPNNRDYKCRECGYAYDRDGVGSINIYKKVSFGNQPLTTERISRLTRPLGVKFKDNLSYNLCEQVLNVENHKMNNLVKLSA